METNAHELAGVDKRDLRNAFGTFLTGVTVVTTLEENGTPRGFTVNSFTSLSLDPPMLLICIDRTAESFQVFTSQSGFAVSVLNEDQTDISSLFASKREDKFTSAPWTPSRQGYPFIDNACAVFDCERQNIVDAGDHVILIGRIVDYRYTDRIGLGYVRGGYLRIGLERTAARAAAEGRDTVVGVLAEKDGRLLIEKDHENGCPTLPASSSLGNIQEQLQTRGFSVSISAIFAVFENEQTGRQSIYYRAKLDNGLENAGMVPLEELPIAQFQSAAVRTMLTRYMEEAKRHRFGVYFGSDKDGSVKALSD